MQRVTITLDEEFVAELDRVMATRGYQNRSEAIRDLARAGIRQAAEEAGEGGQCVAALVYVGIMALLIDGFGRGVLVAAFFAFVIGTAVSFLGNALWSFEARPTADRAVMFFAINTTGLGLNMLIAWLMERAGIHYLLISLTVLVVVPMFNFAGHRIFTFGGAK